MHIPQVWYIRRGGKTRRPLSLAPQHRQREGLHLPLVLVHHPLHPQLLGHRLPHHHHHQPQDESLSLVYTFPFDQARSDQHHCQEELRR